MALGTLLAAGLLAAGVARLARVGRPRYEPVRSVGAAVELGVVRLRGRVLGWSLRCRGVERFVALGPRGFDRFIVAPGGALALTCADDRCLVVRVADCATASGRAPPSASSTLRWTVRGVATAGWSIALR